MEPHSPRAPRSPRSPHLSLHEVSSVRIHPSVDGFRIAQISDLHVRTGVQPKRLHRAVELLNQMGPDLVVLTGDYVCYSTRSLPLLTEALRELKVPAFATLGNHDHWSDARQVRAALERAGVDVLVNEHRRVRAGHGIVHLVGLDDSVTRHDDPARAFAGVPTDATRVVLSHDPKSADRLGAYSPALILSGHTHGGQIFVKRLTPYLSSRAGIKYLSGFFEVGGAILFVNRGLGAAVPVRFRSPAEVAQLTLRSAHSARATRAA